MDVPSGVKGTGHLRGQVRRNPHSRHREDLPKPGVAVAAQRRPNGHQVTRELVERMIDAEVARIRGQVGDHAHFSGRSDDASTTFTEMDRADDHPDFLALPAYERMP